MHHGLGKLDGALPLLHLKSDALFLASPPHTFSAFWLWSSVVSVLISVTTDILPTGRLLVTPIFQWGGCSLSLLEGTSSVALALHQAGCGTPLGVIKNEFFWIKWMTFGFFSFDTFLRLLRAMLYARLHWIKHALPGHCSPKAPQENWAPQFVSWGGLRPPVIQVEAGQWSVCTLTMSFWPRWWLALTKWALHKGSAA